MLGLSPAFFTIVGPTGIRGHVKDKQTIKAEKRAGALRENLQKRKAQAKGADAKAGNKGKKNQ